MKHIVIEGKKKGGLFNILTGFRSLLIGLRFKWISQWHEILFHVICNFSFHKGKSLLGNGHKTLFSSRHNVTDL